jgi:hypothetical protein
LFIFSLLIILFLIVSLATYDRWRVYHHWHHIVIHSPGYLLFYQIVNRLFVLFNFYLYFFLNYCLHDFRVLWLFLLPIVGIKIFKRFLILFDNKCDNFLPILQWDLWIFIFPRFLTFLVRLLLKYYLKLLSKHWIMKNIIYKIFLPYVNSRIVQVLRIVVFSVIF